MAPQGRQALSGSNWYAEAAAYLGGFPDNYLVIDTETTDVDVESPATLPVQLGYALVIDRKLEDSADYLVNWTLGPKAVPQPVFADALMRAKVGMERKGKIYHSTWESIGRDGLEPVEALRDFRDLVALALDHGYAIVAHNGYAFDRILLQHWWRRVGETLFIPPERLIDTGLLEKSYQMGWSPPLVDSCPRDYWYNKIRDARSRVRWSLDGACVTGYDLVARHKLDLSQAHNAGFDCVLCHYLLEAMRERAESGLEFSVNASQTRGFPQTTSR
jgi:hypothetical protein